MNTQHIRVTKRSKELFERQKEKYGYKSLSNYMDNAVVPIMSNSEVLSDLFSLEKGKKKNGMLTVKRPVDKDGKFTLKFE